MSLSKGVNVCVYVSVCIWLLVGFCVSLVVVTCIIHADGRGKLVCLSVCACASGF